MAPQLQVAPEDLDGYGVRGQTRTDHLRLVLQYAGWQTAGMLAGKELEEFLLARAMEHDSPSLLFRLACEHLRSSKVVRPGVVTLLERVVAARAAAVRETFDRLAHRPEPLSLTPPPRHGLAGWGEAPLVIGC